MSSTTTTVSQEAQVGMVRTYLESHGSDALDEVMAGIAGSSGAAVLERTAECAAVLERTAEDPPADGRRARTTRPPTRLSPSPVRRTAEE
ncbi:Hypothetical predicted protein [Pelobates cultripes]|uniref:Uncharacterized protein n=1 Tax=Pelobates cultripes TaxID=61616 RepID=A0AAD1RST9_PELCU|nr:Hypothetical predicted protein [Pelobates cultripes]